MVPRVAQEGCFTPGNLSDTDNPYTDFEMYYKKADGACSLINTGTVIDTYPQHGWHWFPMCG